MDNNKNNCHAKRCTCGVLAVAVTLYATVMPFACSTACAQEKKSETAVQPQKTSPEKAGDVKSASPAQAASTPAKPDEPKKPQAADAQQADVRPADEAAPVEPGNVTVNFKGADIRTVLAYISEVAGMDIVVAPGVKQIFVDLKLTNKPWKLALDVITKNNGLNWYVSNNIINVIAASQMKPQDLGMRTFVLNYGNAQEVAGQIGDLLKESEKKIEWVSGQASTSSIKGSGDIKKGVAGGSADMQTVKGASASSSAFISTNLKISSDPRTNSISVVGDSQYIDKVAELVKLLDTQTPQVMIEARVIETVLGDDERLGIDWNVKITATGAKRPTTFPFDSMKTPFQSKGNDGSYLFPQVQPNTDTAVVPTGAATATAIVPTPNFPLVAGGVQGFPFALKDNFTFGTLDFTEFKAVLEMLKSRSDTETVSNPRIATLNNYLATINVGETVYLPTFERNSTTGKMEITGYEQTDAGIVLNVVPHVNDNKEISMDLLPQIIDYLGMEPVAPGSDIFAPKFRIRQARTQVMIKDGQTIFIGGLINDRNVERNNKLPFIGDMLGNVPYLGLLVSHKTIIKQRVELIFFITVRVMSIDKKLTDVPTPEKAYTPVFTDTQSGDTAKSKKRLKRSN